MTPEHVHADFERTMGCTTADLLRQLPAALPHAAVTVDSQARTVQARFSDGTLRLTWRDLPEQRIALLVIPRLQVRFEYSAMSPVRRHEVQVRFDLATQRGGG